MDLTEKKFKIYDRALATLSTLAIVLGGFWTLWGFIRANEKENFLTEQKIKMENFNDKKAIYYELCDAEGEIVACNNYNEVVLAQKHFRKLYVGRAHINSELDVAVNNQKIKFGNLLDEYLSKKSTEDPYNYFAESALELSDICKKNLDINSLYKNK